MTRDFSSWQRQHPFGVLLLWLRIGSSLAKSLFPMLVPIYLNGGSMWLNVVLFVSGLATVALVTSLLQHRRFQFRVLHGELQIRKGVLFRKELAIPGDRIQALHFKQSAAQRLVNVTGLSIDTAGNKGNEIEFMALQFEAAYALRDAISLEIDAPVQLEESTSGSTSKSETWATLVQLNWRDIIRHALTLNILRNGLAVIAFPLVMLPGWEEWFSNWLSQVPIWMHPLLFVLTLLTAIPFMFFTAALGLAASVVISVIRFWKLKLQRNASGQIHLQAGLIKRYAFTIGRPKIQVVKWKTNAVSRQFGIASTQWSQAQADATSGASQFAIPAVEAHRVKQLDALLFPEWSADLPVALRPAPIHRWLGFARWCVTAVGVIGIAGVAPWSIGLAAVLLAIGWKWSKELTSRQYVRHNGSDFAHYRGWRVQLRTMTRLHQVQRVEFKQNAWHAFRGIAHVHLLTAGGTIRLRYLNANEAREFADLVLFQIESNSSHWM